LLGHEKGNAAIVLRSQAYLASDHRDISSLPKRSSWLCWSIVLAISKYRSDLCTCFIHSRRISECWKNLVGVPTCALARHLPRHDHYPETTTDQDRLPEEVKKSDKMRIDIPEGQPQVIALSQDADQEPRFTFSHISAWFRLLEKVGRLHLLPFVFESRLSTYLLAVV
jgi:hypothetical protein